MTSDDIHANSISFNRSIEISTEIRNLLQSASELDSFTGHDKQLLRQLGILLYLTNRPRTEAVVSSLEPFLVAMDADFQMLLARLLNEMQ